MRVLVVGLGRMGSFHARRLPDAVAWLESRPGLTTGRTMLVGAVDTAGHGHYGTLEEALRSDWDAAVVATPIPALAETTAELVAAGIPTLVEKPGALTELEALEVNSAAAAAGVLVSVGWIERCNPVAAALALQLPSIGHVERIESVRTGPTGGMSAAIDLAVHDLDLALALGLGDVEHDATARHEPHRKERRFTVHGSDGVLSADLRTQQLSLWHGGDETPVEISGGIDPLTLELATFIRAVEANADSTNASLAGAARVIRTAYELAEVA
jgi:predicted dehydrogenase